MIHDIKMLLVWWALTAVGCGLLQPVGFVTFSSRTDAEDAMEDLQVRLDTHNHSPKRTCIGLVCDRLSVSYGA